MKILFVDEFGRENHKATAKITEGKKTSTWENLFRSGYTESEFPTGDPDEMRFLQKYYSFGHRMAVEKNVLDSDRMKICFLYSVAQYAEAAGISEDEDIEVIVGATAPIDQHGKEQARYKEYYESINNVVTYHGKHYFIRVEQCFPFPEGKILFAAYQKACKENDILVLEIGSRTMNVAVYHKDIHTSKWCVTQAFTKPVGCLLLLNSIRAELSKEGIVTSEQMVEASLYGHKVSDVNADRIRIVSDTLAKRYIEQKILGSLIEENVPLGISTILGGGTGDMLHSRLENELTIIENSGVYANARGALITLEALAKKLKLG